MSPPSVEHATEAPWRILLVEDDEEDFILTRDVLADVPGTRYELEWVKSFDEGIDRLHNGSYDLCLLDYRLGPATGIQFLETASELGIRLPVVLLTSAGDEELDRAVMEAGASDFLEKAHLSVPVIERSIRYALEHHRIESAQRLLADAGRALAASLDHDTTLGVAARVAVPAMSDWSWIFVPEPGSEKRAVDSFHARAEMEEAVRPLTERPFDLRGSPLVQDVLDSARTVLITPFTRADADRFTRDQEQRESLASLTIESLALIPLQLRGEVRGVLALGRDDGRRAFTPADRARLDELGSAIAVALANAELYETARDAVRLRSDLLAMVSHDLGNPLAAVTMVAERLSDRLEDYDDPRVQNHLDMIQRATSSMVRMVEDLLQAGRAEAGHFTIDARPTELAPVIERTMRQFGDRTEEAGVELASDLALDDISVELDEVRISQVLSNLLANALRFTPRGGRIRVEGRLDGDEILISVSDSGPGIEPEDLPHLFDRFWQARKNRTGGAGLGLTIAREIVTGHGGRIWAESTLGEGSTFRFTLPLPSR